MERLGYCRDLKDKAESVGMKVVKHEPFEHTINPSNPTAITIIEKEPTSSAAEPQFVCPNFGDALTDRGNFLYSSKSLRAYPKILDIPCLRVADAILATKLDDFSA